MFGSSARILMITPFHSQQRGNSLTATRLQQGLESRGLYIDLLSLEQRNAPVLLEAALQEKKYDLIQAFNARHLGHLLTVNPLLEDYPIILTTTGTDIHYDMVEAQKELVEKAFQTAQKIVLFHPGFISSIDTHFPGLHDKFVVIPQGVDLPAGPQAERKQFDLEEHDFVFLLPSGLRPVKNIHLAIDALERIQPKYPELRLLIIGPQLDHAYSQTILERIAPLDWVRYPGEIPHENMYGLLKMGDVVLNTSNAEGQPQAALEAMSLGKPCILTAVPGNLYVIESGREGFYVHDETELIKAARSFLTDPRLAPKMGQAARKLTEEKFSLDEELSLYVDLYQRVSQSRKDHKLHLNPKNT